MPKAVAEEQSLYYFEEDGTWHNFILQKVEEKVVEYTIKENHQAYKRGRLNLGDKDSFTNWEWTFKGADGPYAGDEITIRTNDRLSTNRDGDLMRMMVEAFIGGPLQEGQEIDTDEYEGAAIQVTFKNLDPREGNDGRMYYNSTFGECAPGGVAQGSVEKSSFLDEPPF